MKEAGCTYMILVGIVTILLLYAINIVLMARHPCDLNKQLRNLKDFYSTWVWLLILIQGLRELNPRRLLTLILRMTTTTSRKWLHTNIMESILITRLTKTIALRKGLMEARKFILVLKTIVSQLTSSYGMKRNFSLRI